MCHCLLEGEVTGIKVDIDTFFQTHSEEHPSLTTVDLSDDLLKLFLRHGALKKSFEPENDETHPLTLLLRRFRSYGWTPEQSIFHLIILLCIKSEVSELEELRSLVENGTKEVEDEIVNCVIEGKVMKLAALILLAAPHKVTTTKFSFDIDRSNNRSTTIRQYLLREISMLKATQTSFDYIYHDETDHPLANHKDLSSSLNEKLALRMSQLHLLEIFERVGDIIVTYIP
ncbi:hypothetical protein COLO4_27100 [Corchorus olitorius]|uniref:Uncharacterized protein n=1 Tax=Corchorus olitorius TaxID=93759 RepID=A0A1R3HT29_9ROSI|nr:hypothetical protein COLO4_27100 [Corchorus olitorius]